MPPYKEKLRMIAFRDGISRIISRPKSILIYDLIYLILWACESFMVGLDFILDFASLFLVPVDTIFNGLLLLQKS